MDCVVISCFIDVIFINFLIFLDKVLWFDIVNVVVFFVYVVFFVMGLGILKRKLLIFLLNCL